MVLVCLSVGVRNRLRTFKGKLARAVPGRAGVSVPGGLRAYVEECTATFGPEPGEQCPGNVQGPVEVGPEDIFHFLLSVLPPP